LLEMNANGGIGTFSAEIARQQGMLRYLGVRQIDNIMSGAIRKHDHVSGFSLANSFGLLLT
jgi:molybdate transport system ATP-binding protein